MNENIENTLDDARFDRLVDGQLDERQRRELLSALDDEPGGWRRCALAFLEAQCWREAFGPLVAEPDVETTVEPQARKSPWTGRAATVLAMAASFVVAMWIGLEVQRHRSGRDVSNGVQQIARQENIPQTTSEAPEKPWQVVNVSMPGGDGQQERSFNLPAIERDQIDKQWMQSIPQAIPKNVREALARTGHEIKQRRELVPMPLEDGRQLVMPVDAVDVHYVGNGPY